MQRFNGNDSRNIFESLKRQLNESIAELKPEELDSTDRNEWIDYWINGNPLKLLAYNNDEFFRVQIPFGTIWTYGQGLSAGRTPQ